MPVARQLDKAGNELYYGDVCVRALHGVIEYVVYKKEVYGATGSKGEYGRFVTKDGETSIKFRNILLAFDPLSSRRPKAGEVIRKYYEEK